MARWSRSMSFSSDHQAQRMERWEYRSRIFEVEVRVGKELDVLALKGTDLEEVRSYAKLLERTAVDLYGPASQSTEQRKCPVCRSPLVNPLVELRVFGVPYVRCGECGHVAVGRRPDPRALGRVFAESEGHSAAYVDGQALETRMQQIIAPKIEWSVEHYQRYRGRAPQRVLDVGAGGGHFLAGAQHRGMEVEGFEKSRASRAFAKEAFGLELRADEFATAQLGTADLVTFWGLLEYVQEPRDFLAAARRAVAPGGMLIVEVPRADALSTRVQAVEGAVVARHMDPTTHVNAFSDASLCTALAEEGFAPIAAWYFGMDAYEALVQAALRDNDPDLLRRTAHLIPPLQQAIDLGRQCDDIVVAAVPVER
jgi:2-polyprenyl-3-methyl-5-hydroxy-6-metoxy-1,4-benzoquinol methylase